MALGKPDQALTYLEKALPNCLGIAHSLAARECRRALAIDNPTDPLLHTVVSVPPKLPPDAGEERIRGLLADVKGLTCSTDEFKKLWKGMSEDLQRSFININIADMKDYFTTNHQAHEQRDAGIDFVRDTHSWVHWICPCCKDTFLDGEMLWPHGLKQILVNLPENESCKDAGLSLTFDETRQIALDHPYFS